jgi:4-hydroxy-2-oxoheptanedioate aldolase
MKDIREALGKREVLIGTGQEIPHPAVTEMLGYVGWDYVVINFAEMAASPFGMDMENLVRAAYVADICPIVKLATVDAEAIAKAINAGAKAVTMTINTKDELVAAMKAAKYPPQGIHKAAPFRATKYGMVPFPQYQAEANESISVWPILEEKTGVENMEDILSVEGLQVITIGSNDLALSLGGLGDPDVAREVDGYWKRLADLSDRKNVAVQFFGMDTDSMRRGIELGCSLLLCSNDLRTMTAASRQRLIDLNKAIAKQP